MIRFTFARLRTLAFFAAAACSSGIPRPEYAAQPSSALTQVLAAPPPGRIEELPARPRSPAVWIDGEWSWRRERWAWVRGRWVTPAPRARFSPWVFVRGPDGRLWYAPGTWRDARGSALPAPATLAGARVESTQIIDAQGLVETTGPTLLDGGGPSTDGGST